jgi:FkbM family methyltransferase
MPITFLYQVVNLWLNVRHEMQRGVIVPTLHALSSVDGATVTMQFREDSTTSSRDWNPDSEDWRTTLNVSIQTISLPSLLHDVFPAILKFPPIDLLKIDCEGCEYDVIPALSEEHISSISHAVAETHYDGMLKNGRAGPPVSQVERTHQRLCQQWSVCIDAVSGKNYDPPYRPSATLLQKL